MPATKRLDQLLGTLNERFEDQVSEIEDFAEFLEQFSFGFTKHNRKPWMPACAGMTDEETSSSVISAKAGIQFLVNAFAIRSKDKKTEKTRRQGIPQDR